MQRGSRRQDVSKEEVGRRFWIVPLQVNLRNDSRQDATVCHGSQTGCALCVQDQPPCRCLHLLRCAIVGHVPVAAAEIHFLAGVATTVKRWIAGTMGSIVHGPSVTDLTFQGCQPILNHPMPVFHPHQKALRRGIPSGIRTASIAILGIIVAGVLLRKVRSGVVVEFVQDRTKGIDACQSLHESIDSLDRGVLRQRRCACVPPP
mmetsp:Transcript_23932/g.66319  ORF Transcript_23932/g.66319 Transcript_23932/m.66319 type:complete len:204 (-) Transcript_23932:113-724(-)